MDVRWSSDFGKNCETLAATGKLLDLHIDVGWRNDGMRVEICGRYVLAPKAPRTMGVWLLAATGVDPQDVDDVSNTLADLVELRCGLRVRRK